MPRSIEKSSTVRHRPRDSGTREGFQTRSLTTSFPGLFTDYRLTGVIDDLLLRSRMDRGHVNELISKTVNLSELIEGMARMISARFRIRPM